MRKQIALCIGNDEYQYPCLTKLSCASNDACSMSEKLSTMGYETQCYTNLDCKKMHQAVDEFEKNLTEYDVGLFYYAGHGFECNGLNLLMPIDTESCESGYREWMALKLDTVIDAMQGKNIPNKLKIKIIILDACRENPDGRGNKNIGFFPVFAPAGTIIAFSTSPGQSAKEKDGHGQYTKALLNCIDIPRIPIENMFKQVRGILAGETSGSQISWEHTSLMDNYYFNEDRIDSLLDYSHEAYEDCRFYINESTLIGSIIKNLKTHNWYTQNSAISQINMIAFNSESPSELFVLGRNIYQAASGGAWRAVNFIKEFATNKRIPDNAKIHLLNGMAFEIYFNSQGKPRNIFKTSHYTYILEYLEIESFQSSKNFILEKLENIVNNVIYMPGTSQRIALHITSNFNDYLEDDDQLWIISQIFYNGHNILSYNTGKGILEGYIPYSSAKHLDSIRDDLAQMMVSPPDMLVLTADAGNEDNIFYALPLGSSLINSSTGID